MKQNERELKFFDEIWEENGYEGEQSIPSQIGEFFLA